MAYDGSQQRRGRWWIGLVISLAALILATWGVQPSRLAGTLATARLEFLPFILALQMIGISTRARAWHIFLGDVPYRRAFAALNEGYLLNNLLPVRMGEFARAYLVRKGTSLSTSQALGSVLVERLADVAIALGALLLVLPRLAAPDWAADVAGGVGLGLAVGLVGLVVLFLSRRTGPDIIARLPGAAGRILPRLVRGLTEGLHAAGRPRRLVPGVLWLFSGWVAAWLQFEAYLRLFGATGSPAIWMFSLSVIAFGGAVPSSPGAVGVFELAGSAALRSLGYTAEVALSVAAAMHLVQIVVTAILGGWFLSREGQSIADLVRAARDLARRPAGTTGA